MRNRLAIVAIALGIGLGGFLGVTLVEDALQDDPGPPVEGEVVATNATVHLDRVGRPTAIGEVINGLDAPIGPITVRATFLVDGEPVGTVRDTALVDVIPAGGRAPFALRLENRSVRPTAVDLSVGYDRHAGLGVGRTVVVENGVTDQSQTQVTVGGQVEYRGDTPASVRVVGTFYDANGSVVGVRSTPTSPRILDPGERGDFQLRLRTLGNVPSRAGSVADYRLVVETASADDG